MKCKVVCSYLDSENRMVVDEERRFDNGIKADIYACDYVTFKPYGRAKLDMCDDDNNYLASYVYMRTDCDGVRVVRRKLGLWENMFNPTYP